MLAFWMRILEIVECGPLLIANETWWRRLRHTFRQFGERFGACVRETDFVARLAGDEFVIVLRGRASQRPRKLSREK